MKQFEFIPEIGITLMGGNQYIVAEPKVFFGEDAEGIVSQYLTVREDNGDMKGASLFKMTDGGKVVEGLIFEKAEGETHKVFVDGREKKVLTTESDFYIIMPKVDFVDETCEENFFEFTASKFNDSAYVNTLGTLQSLDFVFVTDTFHEFDENDMETYNEEFSKEEIQQYGQGFDNSFFEVNLDDEEPESGYKRMSTPKAMDFDVNDPYANMFTNEEYEYLD